MTKTLKRTLTVVISLCLAASLSACGIMNQLFGGDTVTPAVKGNLDSIYLGIHDPDYLEIVNCTEDEAEADYIDGLEYEAEFFSRYWGIIEPDYGETYEDLEKELKDAIVELYKKIYAKSKYEVQKAVALEDGSYSLKILVDPIDIMEKAVSVYENDEYEPLNAFWKKFESVDFSTMSETDYAAYTNEYGMLIVDLVESLLPELGYKEQKSMIMQYAEDDDGYFTMNSDDLATFDEYVIYYP